MARVTSNEFTSYELTDREQLEGMILNISQEMYFQTRLAEYARQKLNIKYDPASPMEFVQQEAELQGQIGLLRLILDESTEAKRQMVLGLKDADTEDNSNNPDTDHN